MRAVNNITVQNFLPRRIGSDSTWRPGARQRARNREAEHVSLFNRSRGLLRVASLNREHDATIEKRTKRLRELRGNEKGERRGLKEEFRREKEILTEKIEEEGEADG